MIVGTFKTRRHQYQVGFRDGGKWGKWYVVEPGGKLVEGIPMKIRRNPRFHGFLRELGMSDTYYCLDEW